MQPLALLEFAFALAVVIGFISLLIVELYMHERAEREQSWRQLREEMEQGWRQLRKEIIKTG